MEEGGAVERVRKGDSASFEALIEPLIKPGCQLAYSFLHDWAEAEDAVQDACVNAWRATGRLRPGTTSLRAWFLTIVANQARSRRRGPWWSLIRQADPAAASPERDIQETVPLRADLEAAMNQLSQQQRTILMLHFYLDLPLDEIGRILGLSTDATKSRMYRATRSLRPAMALQEVGP
jgi:RNA polymerase sigma-70 factor (ECF subfamily)